METSWSLLSSILDSKGFDFSLSLSNLCVFAKLVIEKAFSVSFPSRSFLATIDVGIWFVGDDRSKPEDILWVKFGLWGDIKGGGGIIGGGEKMGGVCVCT